MAEILVLHGPNLNMLGKREPELYGHSTLDDINKRLLDGAEQIGHIITTIQSNSEAVLIDQIQACTNSEVAFIIINPAALGHTSIALRDALLAVDTPFIEVHLSNIYSREPFRRHSYLSDIAEGVIVGLGAHGYELALLSCANFLMKN